MSVSSVTNCWVISRGACIGTIYELTSPAGGLLRDFGLKLHLPMVQGCCLLLVLAAPTNISKDSNLTTLFRQDVFFPFTLLILSHKLPSLIICRLFTPKLTGQQTRQIGKYVRHEDEGRPTTILIQGHRAIATITHCKDKSDNAATVRTPHNRKTSHSALS